MKNMLLAILGLVLLFTPLAATPQQFGDFTYSSDGSAITITGYTGLGGAVTLPDTITGLPVTTIGGAAFSSKTNVTGVIIPGTVTSIAGRNARTWPGAFAHCTSLTNVIIPSSVTDIGGFAFSACTSLTSVTIPGSVTNFGASAFEICVGLSSVTILFGITGIGDNAFDNCLSLANVTLPGSVTSIGNSAFAACTSLTHVTIPGGVTNIGTAAFASCDGLISINVDAANAFFCSLDGVLFDKSQTTLIQYPCGKAANYVIPGSVTSIGDYAFVSCTNLTSVMIPGSVIYVGEDAFANCTSLANVTIPGSVTYLGGGAFAVCTGLTSINILNGVIIIGVDAFLGCTGLTSVTLPGSITSIDGAAFQNCTSLQRVFFTGNAPIVGLYPADPFYGDSSATVYYLPGTTGWGATFAGRPTKLWNPLMQSSSVGPSGFGFNITGTADIPIVVEASTNLVNANWVSLQSLNLTNGAFYFSDPTWTNCPARFYRIRSP